MFEDIGHNKIIVTGPHRTGTTICAEMIGHDTGLPVFREEEFQYRNIIKAHELISIEKGLFEGCGVFQGPYLLPWAPLFDDCLIVCMRRDIEDIQASIENLKKRGISTPFFSAEQAYALWEKMELKHCMEVEYESLRDHPLWSESRKGWGHRQTRG